MKSINSKFIDILTLNTQNCLIKNIYLKMPIKKTIILNGRKVEAWVPDPRIPKEEALERFKKAIKEIVARKIAAEKSKKATA